MKTGMDLLKERCVVLTDEYIPESEFVRLGLPMIVQCTSCITPLALPDAYIDVDNHVYCNDCAAYIEPDDFEDYEY